MSKAFPQPSDFPHSLAPIIHSSATAPTNVVLFLHGLGDTATNFSSFARALNLPETLTITLQGFAPLPLPLGALPQGYHWGDDIVLDQSSGELEPDAGFETARKLVAEEVIRKVLMGKCGFKPRQIMILGYGQGAMLGLAVAKDLGDNVLGGVLSIGGPLPSSARLVSGALSKTPVMLLGGSRGVFSTSTGMAVKAVEGTFGYVENHQWRKADDTMPKNREEALPMMQFFARRLRSTSGVPEGAFELGG